MKIQIVEYVNNKPKIRILSEEEMERFYLQGHTYHFKEKESSPSNSKER